MTRPPYTKLYSLEDDPAVPGHRRLRRDGRELHHSLSLSLSLSGVVTETSDFNATVAQLLAATAQWTVAHAQNRVKLLKLTLSVE